MFDIACAFWINCFPYWTKFTIWNCGGSWIFCIGVQPAQSKHFVAETVSEYVFRGQISHVLCWSLYELNAFPRGQLRHSNEPSPIVYIFSGHNSQNVDPALEYEFRKHGKANSIWIIDYLKFFQHHKIIQSENEFPFSFVYLPDGYDSQTADLPFPSLQVTLLISSWILNPPGQKAQLPNFALPLFEDTSWINKNHTDLKSS
jgi:hypothetical protein